MATIWQDNNPLFVPAGLNVDQDSQYLYLSANVVTVASANSESSTNLTADFSFQGGRSSPYAGPSVPLAQICVPTGIPFTFSGTVLARDEDDVQFAVPIESFTPVGFIDPDADGPYQISVDETLGLDASATLLANCWDVTYEWDLDGDDTFETDAGSQAFLDVGYANLLALGLGPDPGNPSPIQLRVSGTCFDGPLSEIAATTLEIVPEPAGLALLAVAALGLARRRKD